MTHTQSVFTIGGMGRNISTTHTIVAAVLTLPDHPAAMTRPLSLAIIRRPLTANSRQMTMSSIQAGICPISTNHSMAAVTSILSARGSANLPKSVTRLYFRAILPSSMSVRLAMMKMASATHVAPGKPQYSTTMKTGIRIMRKSVNLLGKFMDVYSSANSPVSSPSMTPVSRTVTKVPGSTSRSASNQMRPSMSGDSA